MLRELHIKNVAVIEEVAVEFENGFQTLTGETGAGKSILIDSINMALGGRGSRELIRTGAEFAAVDLAFEIEDEATVEKLSELGIKVFPSAANFLLLKSENDLCEAAEKYGIKTAIFRVQKL